MESKRTSFLAALAVLWRAGIGGKLFMALILLLLVGLADAGPRYARFFEAIYGASGATIQPIHVPP
ncbi:MAG TPA: hypothetical protein VJ983_09850, partial [candidate division Zixibacteria bacterium]|nr:hypothetical protein [candidate division Zixibacteria bacterium]